MSADCERHERPARKRVGGASLGKREKSALGALIEITFPDSLEDVESLRSYFFDRITGWTG